MNTATFPLADRLNLAASAAIEASILSDALLNQIELRETQFALLTVSLRRIRDLSNAILSATDDAVASKSAVLRIIDPDHCDERLFGADPGKPTP
jgi:hypothetical protein